MLKLNIIINTYIVCYIIAYHPVGLYLRALSLCSFILSLIGETELVICRKTITIVMQYADLLASAQQSLIAYGQDEGQDSGRTTHSSIPSSRSASHPFIHSIQSVRQSLTLILSSVPSIRSNSHPLIRTIHWGNQSSTHPYLIHFSS